MNALLLVAVLSSPQAQSPQGPSPQGPSPAMLQRELAAMVDLEPAAARRARAEALAKLPGVSLDDWLEACRAFEPASKLPAGVHALQAKLQAELPGEPSAASPADVDVDPRDASTVTTELHVYVPEDLQEGRPAPLLLWGHGAGGSGRGQHRIWQAVADRLGMLVLSPSSAASEPGWAFSPAERNSQLQAVRWLRRRADVDENAVFVGGASRGGHMTWDLALRHPDVFAGALPCIGGPRLQIGPQNNLRYLENVAHLPLRCLQGSQDDPLLLMNLHLCFARLQKLGGDQQLIEFEGRGHDFDLDAVDWPAFFAARRQPERARVVRMAAVPGEARASWCEIVQCEPSVREDFELRVGATWERLDDAGKREFVLDRAIRHTARLEVVRKAPGRFEVESDRVTRFRLLLPSEMLGDDGQVAVRWRGRTYKGRPEPDAAVLLAEFAERFDRTFLPVVAVDVPGK